MTPRTLLHEILVAVEASPLESILRDCLHRKIGVHWESLLVCPAKMDTLFMLRIIGTHWSAVFADDFPRPTKSLASDCAALIMKCSKSSNSVDLKLIEKLAMKLQNLLLCIGVDITSQINRLLA